MAALNRQSEQKKGCQAEAQDVADAAVSIAASNSIPGENLPLLQQFRDRYRYQVYIHAVRSTRLRQLLAVFPVLGLKLIEKQMGDALSMVEDGRKLSEIADAARVPMALRKVDGLGAGAYVSLSADLYAYRNQLPNYWERNADRTYDWLFSIVLASQYPLRYGEWIIRNFHELDLSEKSVRTEVKKIGDWVRSRYAQDEADLPSRQFDPNMTARTAQRLSDEWHRGFGRRNDQTNEMFVDLDGVTATRRYTTAEKLGFARKMFPKPWLSCAEIGDIRIEPITNMLQLVEASRYLRNCGPTYAGSLNRGECCLYLAYNTVELVAMIEVRKRTAGYKVVQCAGLRNFDPPAAVIIALEKWKRVFSQND